MQRFFSTVCTASPWCRRVSQDELLSTFVDSEDLRRGTTCSRRPSRGTGLLNRCMSFASATTSRRGTFGASETLDRSQQPYIYGIIVCMKKTLHIDDRLLRNAKSACGAKTDTDTVRLGLEALVRHGAYERLRALRGSEPRARETPRRRERASALDHATA
jgi:Arc/MetJ family transcription regulator